MPSRLALSKLWAVDEYTTTAVLGQLAEFDTFDPTTGLPLYYGGVIEAIYIRNKSGGTLAANTIVLANNDDVGPGAACEGAATAASFAMGVVPWCIPSAGVADGANFWLIKKGPCKFLSDGGNDVAAGVQCITGATGYVSAHTGGTDDFAIVGRMVEAIGAVAGAAKKAIADFRC